MAIKKEIELQIGRPNSLSDGIENISEKQWSYFQYTLVILSFICRLLLVIIWFISLLIINKSVSEITVSGTIGTAGSVKSLNVTIATIVCFIYSWITLIRNIQIRIIFDRFPAYNKTQSDSKQIELTDYICPCCYYCKSNTCGGPIYHNKIINGNCVKHIKYYFTTFRGFNFITTITNVFAWFALLGLYVFDVYKHTFLHLLFTGVVAILMFVFQFGHSSLLLKQRQNEAKIFSKNCKNMGYYWDVIYCFFMPIFAILSYFIHIVMASYLSTINKCNTK